MNFVAPHEADVPYSISGLNRTIAAMIQGDGGLVWVEGEISQLKRASSGHCYLRLIDNGSQIPAVIWKSYATGLPRDIQEGDRVQVIAQVRVYERGGYYQLDIRKIMRSGDGDKLLKLEELKKKLAAEGLFDESRKRPLPESINRVAVITAETGAAFYDIANVISRNAPQIDLILIPAAVQGEHAPNTLINALNQINDYGNVDLIIFGRGGGSAEDLYCFNNEDVVRAVADSQIPIISAVGHEIDTTLSDHAADVRAATPSAAAEIIVASHIGDKGRIDELEQRFISLTKSRIGGAFRKFKQTWRPYSYQQVINRVNDYSIYVDSQDNRLNKGVGNVIRKSYQHFINKSEQLNNLSPLSLLNRGYSVSKDSSGKQLKSINQVEIDDIITVQVTDGIINANVTSKDEK